MSRYEIEESEEKSELSDPLRSSAAQPLTIERSPQPAASDAADLQSGFGNAAVAQLLTQGQDQAPAATGPSALIVEDTAQTLEPGQMRRSQFLSELRDAVCNTTAEALANTAWSEAGCPYIERWFGYYGGQSGQQLERAARRYAPEVAAATSASSYISAITARVRRSVTTWATTGEITGVPMDLPGAGPAAGSGEGPAVAGNLLFKGREGGAREKSDPEAIRYQLGLGHPLDADVSSRMGSAFGTDYSHVRVHTDADAAALSDGMNARAFTVGENIAFGSGEYKPGTPVGDAIIAHELAHVIQQGRASPGVAAKEKGGAGQAALEEDADLAAASAVASLWGAAKGDLAQVGRTALPRLRSGLQLRRCSSGTSLNFEKIHSSRDEIAELIGNPEANEREVIKRIDALGDEAYKVLVLIDFVREERNINCPGSYQKLPQAR